MSLALFLGAGFSKWAANLPVANQLFDFQIQPWEREQKNLALVQSLKREWDAKHPDGLAEQFIADVLTHASKSKHAVLWYITRRLSEPFIHEYFFAGKKRHVLSINDNRLNTRQDIKNVRQFLYALCLASWVGIITTNYDLLVEYGLGTKDFNYGNPGQLISGYQTRRSYRSVTEWYKLKGRTPLAKLHGSISWDESGYYTDGRCGLKGSALIVPPSPDKLFPEGLEAQYRLAQSILIKATRLIVFGFAFNPYDEGVIELLRTFGVNLKSILLINTDLDTHRAETVWPMATIDSCPPPPDGNNTIRKWLMD